MFTPRFLTIRIAAKFVVLVFSLTLAGHSAAQTIPPPPNPSKPSNPKVFYWSPMDPKCIDVYETNTETVFASCDRFVIDGSDLRAMAYKDIGVVVRFSESGKYFVVDALVVNQSKERVLIDPSKWIVIHHKTFDGWLKAEKPIGIESAIDPEKIAKRIEGRYAWANALSAMGGAMARTTSTVNDQSGRTIATVTSPDTNAQANANRQIANNNARAMSQADVVRAASLRANTVFAGEKVEGSVYFKKNKKAQFTELRLEVEGIIYCFTFAK